MHSASPLQLRSHEKMARHPDSVEQPLASTQHGGKHATTLGECVVRPERNVSSALQTHVPERHVASKQQVVEHASPARRHVGGFGAPDSHTPLRQESAWLTPWTQHLVRVPQVSPSRAQGSQRLPSQTSLQQSRPRMHDTPSSPHCAPEDGDFLVGASAAASRELVAETGGGGRASPASVTNVPPPPALHARTMEKMGIKVSNLIMMLVSARTLISWRVCRLRVAPRRSPCCRAAEAQAAAVWGVSGRPSAGARELHAPVSRRR